MPEIMLLLKTKYRISSGKSVKAIAAKGAAPVHLSIFPDKILQPYWYGSHTCAEREGIGKHKLIPHRIKFT